MFDRVERTLRSLKAPLRPLIIFMDDPDEAWDLRDPLLTGDDDLVPSERLVDPLATPLAVVKASDRTSHRRRQNARRTSPGRDASIRAS